MKTKLLLAASIGLAIAAPAFAQKIAIGQPDLSETVAKSVVQPSEPSSSEAAEARMSPVAKPNARASRRYCPASTVTIAESVAPVISEHARPLSAANAYDPCKDAMTKVYPMVDRGHVKGDPPVIDHSADTAPVIPTDSIAAVPSDE